MDMGTAEKTYRNNLGTKISRLRQLRGMKLDSFAAELGISLQAVSKIELSEEIGDETLEKIAKILGLTTEAIKNFNEEAVFNIIGNTVTNHDNGSLFNYQPIFNNINNFHDSSIQNNFNPVEKIIELYERLLASEREKNEILKGK